MGQPLFNVDISGIIKRSVRPLTTVTLVKVTAGTRTAGQLAGGTNPTTTSYSCTGLVVSQQREHRTDARPVSDGTRRILLIGDTISNGSVFPELGDRIIAEGITFQIEKVERDPARATYSCTVRPR